MDSFTEGKTSYHDYSLYKIAPDDADPGDIVTINDIDYVLVDSVEGLKYALLDKNGGVIVDWTNIDLLVEGQIVVPGPKNRISRPDLHERFLTILAVHNGGEQITEEIEYDLISSIGITPTTEPTS
ncbi:MAG: hypothetical protein V3W20_10690 [Candidatus Neomarinimicrobiota bacterium]